MGILFLDELGLFARHALEALRQPMEDRLVRIARARTSVEYPACFLLAAATNPCPWRLARSLRRWCRCTPEVRKYLSRLSGPLLDRIDIQVELEPLEFSVWSKLEGGGRLPRRSAGAWERARRRQRARQKRSVRLNASWGPANWRFVAPWTPKL